ncbi:glycosyl hydrolase family 28-related protein [Paenibacillus ginsengarvi]|nr:glycosyl hydrolase family 28-related protein [Paenibacillus ginsengarvi]
MKKTLSRRQMLATIGMAGASLAGSAFLTHVTGHAGGPVTSVTGDTYGAGLQKNGNKPVTSHELDTILQAYTETDWVHIHDIGCAGDGITNCSPSLLTWLAGVQDHATLYIPAGTYVFAGNVTIPGTVRLLFDHGARFAPDAQTTLTIHAVVTAGLDAIFAGAGHVIGSMGAEHVYPQWWGAQADGVHDDTAAINAAITAVWQSGGGTVFLAEGTYLLASPQGYADALIIPRSNVNLIGQSHLSVLKAADHLNDGRRYGWNMIFPVQNGDPVNNVTFRNFKVDCNGQNNLEVETKSHKNAAIGIPVGSNIVVDQVAVVNNAGRQCFMFGSNRNPVTIRNLTIQNCLFDTVATAVPGNVLQNDHSAIYAQADGCIIANNKFLNPVKDQIATALEIHCLNALVHGNIVQNYGKGFNIVATVNNHVNTIYSHNVVNGCNYAIEVWCHANFTMDRVQIIDNVFEQSVSSLPIINISTQTKTKVTSMTIRGNSFVSTEAASMNRGSGIVVGKVEQLDVSHNRFQNLAGRAIELGVIEPNLTSLRFDHNEIIDCCRTQNQGYKGAISLHNSNKLKALRISNNWIENSSIGQMREGIRSNAHLGQAEITHNTILNTAVQIMWEDSAQIDYLWIDHVGTGTPENTVRASIPSRWIDKSTGTAWTKQLGGNLKTGWSASS